MSSHLDFWRPEMIGRFSARGRAAVEEFKAFVREHVSLAALEERALLLAGLPPSEIDDGLRDCCRELAEELVRVGLPKKWRTGITIALIHGGPNYHELKMLMHVLHHVWQETKKLGRELVKEPDNE
jgi:hypothetical protein